MVTRNKVRQGDVLLALRPGQPTLLVSNLVDSFSRFVEFSGLIFFEQLLQSFNRIFFAFDKQSVPLGQPPKLDDSAQFRHCQVLEGGLIYLWSSYRRVVKRT
jgi:hypothetical protein